MKHSTDSSYSLLISSERGDDLIKEFTNVAREVTRKRQEKFIPIKVVPAHAKLQERTRYLRDWRKQLEQLAVMTGPTKGLGAEVEVEFGGWIWRIGYEVDKRIDVLDVSVGAYPFFLSFRFCDTDRGFGVGL